MGEIDLVPSGRTEIHAKMSSHPDDYRRSGLGDENALPRGAVTKEECKRYAIASLHCSPSSDFGYRTAISHSKRPQPRVPNHREVQYIDDHELQLDQVISGPIPKIPLDVSIRGRLACFTVRRMLVCPSCAAAHWLAIEGKQPTINENPEIISKADLTADSLDPVRHRR